MKLCSSCKKRSISDHNFVCASCKKKLFRELNYEADVQKRIKELEVHHG